MKSIKEELIDFTSWYDANYNGIMITMEEVVDDYLKIKSINSEAPIETPNVNNNEAQKKSCYHPLRYRYIDRDGQYRCCDCHKVIEQLD